MSGPAPRAIKTMASKKQKTTRSDKGRIRSPISESNVSKDWDHDRNLEPIDAYGTGSDYQAYWLCAECGYQWQARIFHRVNGSGCPGCANIRRSGPNKVLSRYAPEVAKEWDYEKNSDTPDDVGTGLHEKRWWRCDECDHSWGSAVAMRVYGHGCPECSRRRRSSPRKLVSEHPLLAEEWSDKNILRADQVGQGSEEKVHWLCRCCSFTWQAAVYKRVEGRGCPDCFWRKKSEPKKFLKDHPAARDFNDDPELLETAGVSSTTRVNWKCGDCKHEWCVSIRDRTLVGSGCPACNKPGWTIPRLRAWVRANQEVLDRPAKEQEQLFEEMGLMTSLAPARSIIAGIMKSTLSKEDVLQWSESGSNRAVQEVIDSHRADHYGGKKGISPHLRNRVYDRDGWQCLACGSKKGLSVDHIIPESKGGDTVLENLQLLCMNCNLKKGTRLISLEELRELLQNQN